MSKKLIPKLRFPEFENKEWNVSPIDDYCDVFRGSTFSKSDITEDGSEPCIHYGELFTKYNEVISRVYSRTDKQDGFKSEAGDVLMPSSDVTPDGLARASAITLGNVILGGDMNILRPYKGTNSIFLSYLLNHSKREIIKLVSGTTVKHIYPSQIITCELPVIDNEAEQQKIASCLSSLDELIAAHNDKLAALKEHKKGLLQNLFPQEGETVPRVRFPEFEGKGVWKPSTVEENCLVKGRIGYRGYTKQDLVKEGEGVLVLGGKNIQNQLLDLSDRTYLSWEKYYESPEIMVEMNHIIFSQRGTLGDCAIIDKEIGMATINPSMVLLRDITCNPKFLYYILIGDRVQAEVSRNSTSSAVPMLSQKQIREFSFLIPDPTEQEKIASSLSAVDELITAQQDKIEELQLHKKGLMQGLFPKMVST
ncbi:restriction endonuclease subunit S [Roseivirga sp. UBA1976]|uniref:restriction endonuclease subunit S n=1 Tax=Roseivirga sp. UBA1976 TaxID=1947386 RepID=UPI00257969FD|nr:restriction endonuclease subunit S [Roseivirga sp. UBA1976]|tara:strand:+ start:11387 stop:12652 length:1266 start_codon:yes stop_codon:yes gene_type:complete